MLRMRKRFNFPSHHWGRQTSTRLIVSLLDTPQITHSIITVHIATQAVCGPVLLSISQFRNAPRDVRPRISITGLSKHLRSMACRRGIYRSRASLGRNIGTFVSPLSVDDSNQPNSPPNLSKLETEGHDRPHGHAGGMGGVTIGRYV